MIHEPASRLPASLLHGYPRFRSLLPPWSSSEGVFCCRFARSPADLEELLRLRFSVFNLELGEGLDESYATGLDLDPFDPWCHHLIVEERDSGRVIGTYRLQTQPMAESGTGFYTAGEYALEQLPRAVLAESVEVGRACIAAAHRKKAVLYLLWRGLAAYMQHHRRRYLFGCCSLPGTDPRAGVAAAATLARRGVVDPALAVAVRPGYECVAAAPPADAPPVELPDLFEIYLRFGGRVCGAPALDRQFGTVDFLVLLDIEGLPPRARRLFFS